jgi:hypothetical protein
VRERDREEVGSEMKKFLQKMHITFCTARMCVYCTFCC